MMKIMSIFAPMNLSNAGEGKGGVKLHPFLRVQKEIGGDKIKVGDFFSGRAYEQAL